MIVAGVRRVLFRSNDTATTEIYTLSLHDALPIFQIANMIELGQIRAGLVVGTESGRNLVETTIDTLDRKSTRLNSSHDQISYAVFCLKKKRKD